MIVRHRYPTRVLDLNVDRAFEQLTNSFFNPSTARPSASGLDATWVDGEYVLTIDLPGVAAEAVGVAVKGNTLTIEADRGDSKFERSIRLGGRLDPAKVNARHVDGRLTVSIGTFDEPEARLIELDTTPAPIEAAADDEVVEVQSSDTSSTG